jgi:hypothetical protein
MYFIIVSCFTYPILNKNVPPEVWHIFIVINSMRILVTNDDGIYSPGIMALAKIASRFGEVQVVAPDVEQSSMGHAITASRPLYYKNRPLLLKAWKPTG